MGILLFSLCNRISIKKDQTIFKEGDTADRFYLILSGEIIISIGGTEIAQLFPGQIFGEMALIEQIPRTATATAAKDTALFAIPPDIVTSTMPSLALKMAINIAVQMSEKLHEINKHTRLS